jgi:nifR3 family TIM-barrel protein
MRGTYPARGAIPHDVAVSEALRSAVNRDVEPAQPGEFAPIEVGPLSVWPPVVLAPMAGVTNYPFRAICRQFGAGLYVSEMITARALVEGHAKTLLLADFGPDESPRSLQLYGVDPWSLGEAAKRLVGEGRVDHIDMNFGCPVRKVTSKGGGAAIPIKPNLLRRLVRAVVANAGDVPVTIKFRIGVNDELVSFLDAGRIGEEEGCAAVGLHARTAAQFYSGEARWEAIARLVQEVSIPVLGNGDVWECWDALRMMRQTGCAGVIVGRGCLGKPWLFRDLADVFDGREPQAPPEFGDVAPVVIDHARRLADWFGEKRGALMMRKQIGWYSKGYPRSSEVRALLPTVHTVADVARVIALIPENAPFPENALRIPRGKSGGTQVVALPEGYLDDLEDDTPPVAAEGVVADGG